MSFITRKKEMKERELRQKRKNKWVQQIIATACVQADIVDAWPMTRYFCVASQRFNFKHLQVINFWINWL